MIQLVKQNGPQWSVVSRSLQRRTGRQVRNRYLYLVDRQKERNDKLRAEGGTAPKDNTLVRIYCH